MNRTTNPRTSAARKKAVKAGYRSFFEFNVAKQLKTSRISHDYEPRDMVLSYELRTRGRCAVCGSHEVVEQHTYLPDFVIGKGRNIVIEAKGKYDAKTRKKMIAVKEQNPEVHIIMLFMSDNKLSKKSKSRYSDWCEQNGFEYYIDNKDKWTDKIKSKHLLR